jgi:tetratricopeptide (TPR) repeat protein
MGESIGVVWLTAVLAGAAAGLTAALVQKQADVVREIVTLIEASEMRHDTADLDRVAKRIDEGFPSATAEAAYVRGRLTFAQSEFARATSDETHANKLLEQAIDQAEAAVSRKPEWAQAHALLADLLGRKIGVTGFFAGMRYRKRIDEALARAEKLDPNSADVHLAVGRQRLHAPGLFGGDIDKAIAAFRRAVALDPERPVARFWLGRALEESGAAREAAAEFRKALDVEPRYVQARRRLERLESRRQPASRESPARQPGAEVGDGGHEAKQSAKEPQHPCDAPASDHPDPQIGRGR